jgi:hypothetical protein
MPSRLNYLTVASIGIFASAFLIFMGRGIRL